ncbi:hypothetical protein ACHAO8_011551, partial [Botrytis cinerea]
PDSSHTPSKFSNNEPPRSRSPPRTTSRFENLQGFASSQFDTGHARSGSQMPGMRNEGANGNVEDKCSVRGLRRDVLENLRDRIHDDGKEEVQNDRRKELRGNRSELARDNIKEPAREPSLIPSQYRPGSTTQFMYPVPRSPHTSPLIRAASRLSHTGNGIASRTYSTRTPAPGIGSLSIATSRICSRASN